MLRSYPNVKKFRRIVLRGGIGRTECQEPAELTAEILLFGIGGFCTCIGGADDEVVQEYVIMVAGKSR